MNRVNIKNLFAVIALPAIFLSAFWFLSRVFSGDLILQQQVFILGFGVHYYGIILGLALLGAVWLAQTRIEQYQIKAQSAEQIFLYAIISGFIGARLYHVISEFGYYQSRLSEVVAVWNGGLSIYGAVLGGVLGLYLYHRQHQTTGQFWRTLDWLAPSVALGQAVGRFGNLFNYEAFGPPTSLPWKMYVPELFRPDNLSAVQFFTPVFLYESVGLLIITYVLLKLSAKSLKPGTLFLSLILMYNTMRIFTENLRLDSIFIGNFRLNMAVSTLLVLVAIYGLSRLYGQEKTSHH